MLIPKHKKVRSRAHRMFVANLPCLITGARDCQAAHIRAKGGAGMGMKSGDDRTLPLSCETHRKQHAVGSEAKFWDKYGGIDKAIELAEALYSVTGDNLAAMELIHRWRNGLLL